jgi:hypothetical protein
VPVSSTLGSRQRDPVGRTPVPISTFTATLQEPIDLPSMEILAQGLLGVCLMLTARRSLG